MIDLPRFPPWKRDPEREELISEIKILRAQHEKELALHYPGAAVLLSPINSIGEFVEDLEFVFARKVRYEL